MSVVVKNLVANINPSDLYDESLKTIKVGGSKHCFLYVFVASLFFDKKTIVLNNVPNISETEFLVDYAKSAGALINYEQENNRIVIKDGIKHNCISTNFVANCRSSLLVITLHILKFGYVKVYSNIGGCNLGERKIDQHIKLWESLGYEANIKNEILEVKKTKEIGDNIFTFDMKTTTGSIAAIYAVAFQKIYKIKGISSRTEINDLINFVNICGCNVVTRDDTIFYDRNTTDNDLIEFDIPSDIDESIGYSCICHAMRINANILTSVPRSSAVEFLVKHSDGEIIWHKDKIIVRPINKFRNRGKECIIDASGHPGIGSDQQPILTVWASNIYENVKIIEYKFLTRFNYLNELSKIGWESQVSSGKAITKLIKDTNSNLQNLIATDLRAGFAEILGAIITNKQVNIYDFEQVLRGYSNVIDNLIYLGVNLTISEYKNNDSVAIMITNSQDKVIMQKRDKNANKNPNILSFWGGAINDKESPEIAAKREIFEELGVTIKLEYVGKYYINKRCYSNTGSVYMYRAEVKETSSLNCKEGSIYVGTIEECLNQKISTFARAILEELIERSQ